MVCMGDAAPMRLINRALTVGDRLGRIPASAPLVPLQHDLNQQQKRLRLKVEAVDRTLDLDLREPTDLARSHLLHRLTLLAIPWGKPQPVSYTHLDVYKRQSGDTLTLFFWPS